MSFWPHPTGLVQAQFVRGFSNHHFVHIHICSCWPPATPYCKQDKVCSPYPNIENLQPFTSESFSSMNFCCDPTWTFYCCKTGLPLFSQDIPFSFFSQWPLPRVCLLHLPQTTSPFFPLFKASLVFKIQLKSYLLRVEVEELYYFPVYLNNIVSAIKRKIFFFFFEKKKPTEYKKVITCNQHFI